MENPENRREREAQNEVLQSQIEVVRDEEGLTTAVIVREGDNVFDLYDYLPDGTIFIAHKLHLGYQYWPGDSKSEGHPPKVCFPEEEINSTSGRLGILHEMGHAIDATRRKPPVPYGAPRRQRDIFLIVREIQKSEEYQQLGGQDEKDEHLVQEFREAIKSGPLAMSDEEILVSIKGLAREERDAWAASLRLHRQIKKEKGVDLFGGMTNKEITTSLEEDLAAYQRLYAMLVPQPRPKLFLTKDDARDANTPESR